MMEEYARGLRVLDGIYAEVSSDERYLVCARVTPHDSWRLTATDLADGLWEKEIFFDEMQQQKKALGFSGGTWRDFLTRLAEALRSDSLIVGLNEKDQMKLTAWCYHSGRQVSYNYTLLPADEEEIKPKIADMVFDLLALARRTKQAELEAHELLSQVDVRKDGDSELASQTSSLSSSSSSSQTLHKPSSLSASSREPEPVALANTVPTNAQSKGVKRKPGFSLINPRVKRWYGEKGARIGTAPNKIAPQPKPEACDE